MRTRVLNKYLVGAFVLTLSMLVYPPDALTQPRERVERVQFPPGQTATKISGEAPLGRRDTYIFHADKGQTISGELVWQGKRAGRADDQGLSGFIFIEPDGTSHKDPQDFYFVAKTTGDYRVVVRASYRMTNYRYRFELSVARGDQTESEVTKQAPQQRPLTNPHRRGHLEYVAELNSSGSA
jgi:hypothetical protein